MSWGNCRSLQEFFNRWCKREHVESNALNSWKLNILKIIDGRISFYCNNLDLLPPKPKFSFRHLNKGIQEFHRRCVLAPADLGRRFGTCKMHLSPPVAYVAVRSTAVVLLLLTFCLLLLPLWESVIVLCFVVCYFMSILELQSSWWGRKSWLLCLICLPGVSWLLSGSSSRCHGVVCGLWLWFFLIILTFFVVSRSRWPNTQFEEYSWLVFIINNSCLKFRHRSYIHSVRIKRHHISAESVSIEPKEKIQFEARITFYWLLLS